ncbi:MAG: dihydroorotate dehydrogenase electron transfer subunit [Candidatus Marinimicrobia bacterium]|nr:dihydroorotate dehydrogenase electron transfer subunit [Candidatus Neomarinimicrobiota bacterium]MCF7850156.1 dihydroorotate dehydrogenase electron transfer subunit [Candidatus Neomarinimicrobiota bacterium]
MKNDRITLPIAGIREENSTLRTYYFDSGLKAAPGQFIMLTVFGQGEKPFSLLDAGPTSFSLTVKRLGAFTQELFTLKEGDLVSVRGPYGKSFSKSPGRVLMVGGGFATPPLKFLAKKLRNSGVDYLVNINGARTADDLLYVDDFQELCDRSLIATDDGSQGHKGTSVDIMRDVLTEDNFDKIYISGPERMVDAAVPVARENNIPFEVNLERYMKCGVGICGSCVMDPTGLILCMEGPILDGETLSAVDDFGVAHRDKTGRRQRI